MAEPAAELVQLKVDLLFPVGPPSYEPPSQRRETPQSSLTTWKPTLSPRVMLRRTAARREPYRPVSRQSRPAGKWLELLKTIVPKLSRIVVLLDATSGPVPLEAVRTVAPSFGVKLQVLEIHTPDEIDEAPSAFRGRPQALIILPSPMMYYQSERLAKLARRQRLPATSMFVPFAQAGGMLAYGPEMAATMERCAELAAKILAGAKPGDLPIERPTKFQFVLNLKTAKALRLSMPDTVLVERGPDYSVITVMTAARAWGHLTAEHGRKIAALRWLLARRSAACR